jgi:hypothetical protein
MNYAHAAVALNAGAVFAAIAFVAYVLFTKEKLRKRILRMGSDDAAGRQD